jgi:long-chain acyl-CoA synthetase
MTNTDAGSAIDWRAAYLDDARLHELLGPGAPFEIEEIEVDGVPVRSFVRAQRTIIDLFQMGRAHEDLTHIVYGDDRLTFGEVRRRALSLAAELERRFEVVAGDRVALAMRNLPEFVIGFWATVVLGAIVVPLNSWWTGSELAYALEDCGAKATIADEERINRLADSGHEGAVIGVRTGAPGLRGSVPIDDLTGGEPLAESRFAALSPDDPVTILYTSGTTGYPKGAVNTHRGYTANFLDMGFMQAREAVLSGRPPRSPSQRASVAVTPFFHIGGVGGIVGAPVSGSKVVLVHKWDPQHVLALARVEGARSFAGVPTMVRELLDHADLAQHEVDLDALVTGGAASPPELLRRALDIFGEGLQLLNGYGLTETTGAVAVNVGAECLTHLDSVGRPTLTADIQVRDTDGSPLPTGEVGELCVRSPGVAKGYWNDSQATQQSFADGWFRTGDLGYVDDEGFVYVVDRLKDVVIRGGENIYCAEVEAALSEHPDVVDSAVIGLPDDRLGERVCAAIVPREGAEIALSELRSFMSGKVARFKLPEALYIATELPRTATNKTAKPALRAMITETLETVERAY